MRRTTRLDLISLSRMADGMRFRLEVTEDRIRAWIDDQPVVNVEIRGRTLGLAARRDQTLRSVRVCIVCDERRGAEDRVPLPETDGA